MDYAKAIKCALLSQDVYQDFTTVKFQCELDGDPSFIDRKESDTQCALFLERGSGCYFIVFRGSDKKMDWDTNLEFSQQSFEFQQTLQAQVVAPKEQVYPYGDESKSGAKMHEGFVKSYLSVRDDVHSFIRNRTVSAITFTGHSLGGALSTLCAVDIQYNFPDIKIDTYTFGSPRVGNQGFADSFNRRVPNSYRFVYGMDIVPALPRYWQGYRHVANEVHMGSRFSLNFLTQRFKDHAIAQYISAIKSLAG